MEGNQKEPEQQIDLIGYCLGLIDETERAAIMAAMRDRHQHSEAQAWLGRIMSALDAEAFRTPPDLARRVMAEISLRQKTLRLPQRAGAGGGLREGLQAGGEEASRGGAPLSLRELVGLAAAVIMFVGIFVPGYRTARIAAEKTACANSLRQIGTGFASYSEAFGNQLPYAGPVPANAAWLPTDSSEEYVSNSRHVYRLVKGRYVSPEAFVCAGRPQDREGSEFEVESLDDFCDPANNSYSTNFVSRPWRKDEFQAAMPLAADMTPLVDDAKRAFRRGAPVNSMSHGAGIGQNVLRIDMSVFFARTPKVGIEGDDIYRVLGVESYRGLERPRGSSDALLIP